MIIVLKDHDRIYSLFYPGTNLVWEIVSMLRLGQKEILGSVFPNIEILKMSDVESIPGPRTLQTHMQCSYLPKPFLVNKGKIIYVIRNPKDVAVSLYCFWTKLKGMAYGGTWDDFLHLFYEGKRKSFLFYYYYCTFISR